MSTSSTSRSPKSPSDSAELDLNQFGVSQPELGLTDSFLHDVVVKNIGGHWIMLLSYWDGGWVLLGNDPRAVFSPHRLPASTMSCSSRPGLADSEGRSSGRVHDDSLVIGTTRISTPSGFAGDDRRATPSRHAGYTDHERAGDGDLGHTRFRRLSLSR